jgi:hypothetical protein
LPSGWISAANTWSVFPVKTAYRFQRRDFAGYTEAILIRSISITNSVAAAWVISVVSGQ